MLEPTEPLQPLSREAIIDEVALTASLTTCGAMYPPVTNTRQKARLQVVIIYTIKKFLGLGCYDTNGPYVCSKSAGHYNEHADGDGHMWWRLCGMCKPGTLEPCLLDAGHLDDHRGRILSGEFYSWKREA